jgi:hypothetical protein
MARIEDELAQVQKVLRSQYDVVPSMSRLIPTTEIRLARMPQDMVAVLESSPDYQPVLAGAPVWLQIASGNEEIELIVAQKGRRGPPHRNAPDPELTAVLRNSYAVAAGLAG